MAATMSSGRMREVIVAQSVSPRWKEIIVNTGASVSTLQDIKVSDTCGGYTYRDSCQLNLPVHNRFIFWRTSGDVLELEEASLDMTLTGCRVCYCFQDTPIVGGVSVSETHDYVIILVATVASVHRLVFPHPCQLKQRDTFVLSELITSSIFYDASLTLATDSINMHMLNPGGSITAHLTSAISCINSEEEALFALGTTSGSIILLKLPPLKIKGTVIQYEISQSSVMQKLWSGLVPGIIRGNQQACDAALSLEMQPFQGETYIFALCRDLRLRIWATKTRECVLTVNLLEMIGEANQSSLSASGHIIKRVQSPNLYTLVLCVYLAFPDRSQFLLLEMLTAEGKLVIQQRARLTQASEDLINFCVTADLLVTLWTGSNGDIIARTAVLAEATPLGDWTEVLLETSDTVEVPIPPNRDPRDFYLERIFCPKEFSNNDIIRALSVFHRSHDTSAHPEILITTNLYEEVINTVDKEIRNCAAEYEIQIDTYYQLQLEQWGRFYSCCCQYREVRTKLQGVFADSKTGLICLIRKSCISYLRPCDHLERLYLCHTEKLTADDLEDMQFTVEGVSSFVLCEQVHKICNVVRLISDMITHECAAAFLLELQMLNSPVSVAEKIVEALFFEDNNLETEGEVLVRQLQDLQHLPQCLDLLSHLLDAQTAEEGQTLIDDSDAIHHSVHNHLFSSMEASAIISCTFEQICYTRLLFLRDLLILQVLALRLGDKSAFSADVYHTLEQELLPNYCNIIRSHIILYWTSQALTRTSTTSSIDSNMHRLASLELKESGGFPTVRPAATAMSVLESFIQGVGGATARQRVALIIEAESQTSWSRDLMAFVHTLECLIWPLSDETIFSEFLAGSCQYLALQEYVRLLRPWCNWNESAILFFQGLAYLHFDEPHKARRCFLNASEGIATETFFARKLLAGQDGNHRQLSILYFLKVIKQFEEFGMPDMVIALANEAICLADPADPNLATLQSKVFKYQLELGHNRGAYTSLMANPDPSRRKDCLRQLIVVLCERGELDALVEFPYKDMQDEVESVLERRARSVDLATHNYYNLLYAFHVYKNNIRKAASVMYEYGLRLGHEVTGLKGLQQQAQCYLATINVLRLVQPECAWIVKPAILTKEDTMHKDGIQSPSKHSVDGIEKQPEHLKRKVEIIDLSQLEKDYLLLDARLRLIRKNPDPALMSGPSPSSDEMVGILVNAGLYDLAVVVCHAFKLSLYSVFSSLALRCVSLAQSSTQPLLGDNAETASAWEWLAENDIQSIATSRDHSASNHAWKLLQHYLDSFEGFDARYHRCVAEKLLSLGFPLPAWLVNSYKVLNAPQLLRIYLDYDLLPSAAYLVMEYMDALMGVLRGQDAATFGLKGMLKHGPLAVWMPYTCIDQLLGALKLHQSDHTYKQLYKDLQEKLLSYQSRIAALSGVV